MNRLRIAGQYVIAFCVVALCMTVVATVGLALFSLLPGDPKSGIAGILNAFHIG
ncbi:hypothetical protein [Novosphingobium sediminicola]|uniref:Uncharacterized protein n=1 Tax=Novosphingobium sediminicola TaxID=563162 RepID=A0A7W6G8C8_9SPHN|nr:hypothetical protein [Novosphingobium sediminicola]MBB3957085.1 hypothetical protein [Novosphingobium sediminicola]